MPRDLLTYTDTSPKDLSIGIDRMPVDLLTGMSEQPMDLFSQPKTPWYLDSQPVKEVGVKGAIKEGLRQGNLALRETGQEFGKFKNRVTEGAGKPTDLAGPGEVAAHLGTMTYGVPLSGLGQLIDVATNGKYKVGERIANTLIYEPQTNSGKLIRDVLFSPFSVASAVGEKRGDTLLDELQKEYGPDDIRTSLYPAIRKTVWDMAGIAITGKGMHVKQPKGKIAETPPPLDPTFRKAQIKEGLIQSQAQSRPIDLLAKKEAGLKGDIKPEGYMANNLDLFEDRIEMEKFKEPYQEPQIIQDWKQAEPIGQPEIIEPAGPDFVEKATERLGGKVEREPVDLLSEEPQREYGQKISDRSPAFEPPTTQDALDLMRDEALASETKGVSVQDGETTGFSPSSPLWITQLNARMKKQGQPLFSRAEIDNLVEISKSDKVPTVRQSERLGYLEDAANKLKDTHPELTAGQDAIYLEKEGYEILGDKKTTVIDLDQGDTFIGTVDGVKDTYTHAGFDEKGNAIIQDGVSHKLDAFDNVQIEAIKRVKKQPTHTIPESKIVEPAKRGEVEPSQKAPAQTPVPEKQAFEMTRDEFATIGVNKNFAKKDGKYYTLNEGIFVEVPIEEINRLKEMVDPSKSLKDSKIKKPMYHGSAHDIYDINQYGGMIWFTDNPKYAELFAEGKPTKKAFINIKNPIKAEKYVDEKPLSEWEEILDNLGVDTKQIDFEMLDFAPDYGLYYWYDLFPHAGNNYIDAGTINAIKKAGYDGFFAPPETNNGVTSKFNAVVFSEKQIQSTPKQDLTVEPSGKRTITDIAKDINALLGEKGAIGRDLGELTKEQQEAYKRVMKDIQRVRKNAVKVGKTLEGYLKSMEVDPKVISYVLEDATKIQIKPTIGKKEENKSVMTETGFKNTPRIKEEKPTLQNETERVIKKEYGILRDTKSISDDFVTQVDNLFGSISTRLKNINPIIKYRLRKTEFDILQSIKTDLGGVTDYLNKVRKLKSDVRKEYDFARKNSSVDELKSIEQKHGLTEQAQKVRQVLDGIYKRAKEVGINMAYLDIYHPRMVKNYKGLIEYFRGSEGWGEISEAIRAKEKDMPRDMTVEEKAEFINSMIKGYGQKLKLVTGHAKSRTIDVVTSDIDGFYYDSDVSLSRYITRMNDIIESRKFFGHIPEQLKKLVAVEKRVSNRVAVLEAMKKNGLSPEDKITYYKLKHRLDKIKETKERLESGNIEDSIGAYIIELIADGKIDPSKEAELTKLLRARFAPKPVSPFIAAYKNLSYIDTMGSPISAITQIGDLALSVYKGGYWNTTKALPKAIAHNVPGVRRLIKQPEITRQDLGIKNILEEFSGTTRTATAVSKVFKLVGLDHIDAIGKETLINSVLEKHQKLANNPKKVAQLEKTLQPIFEDETKQVIQDLQTGTMSDNVKLLVFNDLLNAQPIALSEMPVGYLQGGNGRVFYMLKTYTLKLLDVYRNDVIDKIKNGDRAEKIDGMKNLVRLTSALVLFNATADEIKDFILGRKTSFDDRMLDTLLRVTGLTKYTIWKARQEGLAWAAMKTIAPPFKAGEALWKDTRTLISNPEELNRGLNITESIPVVGKIYSENFGIGKYKKEKRESNNSGIRTRQERQARKGR